MKLNTKLSFVLALAVICTLFATGSSTADNTEFFGRMDMAKINQEALAHGKDIHKRMIAENMNEMEFFSFAMKGCKLVHNMNSQISFSCPDNVKFNLPNVRESRIFRIVDLEADKMIKADLVWAEGFDGTGVDVVVLDTGIDEKHSELSDSIKGCISFVSGESCNDLNGHGTHVSGIITANGGRSFSGNEATGVSPGAGIYMLKVCGSDGYCYEDDMMAAMEYAVYNIDSRIMSISIGGRNFGSHCDSDPLAAKVNWVADNGYSVVVAAGNKGRGVSTPACASKAIAVGAVDKSGIVPYWSNYGSALDLIAPGVDILSTYSCLAAGDCSKEWYAEGSGTSMSAPHVSGVIALLIDANPYASNGEIKNAIYSTADPAKGCEKCRFLIRDKCYYPYITSCKKENTGAGIVNAYKAYEYVKSLAPECTNDSECDDGIYCNGEEKCVSGSCVPGSPVDCSYLDGQCSEGFCSEDLKKCEEKPKQDGITCDDGLFCTVGDSCVSGICQGVQRDCDDGNPCTTHLCNEDEKACKYFSEPDGTFCDDGLFCTVGDSCVSGTCQGVQRDCDDGISCTVDSCDEKNMECVNSPQNSLCNDGIFCNGEEVCDALLGCIKGSPADCNDNNECTIDSCCINTDSCKYDFAADNTECSEGICCGGGCRAPSCESDLDCKSEDACIIGSCRNGGTCGAECSYEKITECIEGDGCCPEGCTSSNDSDCAPESILCWEGSNKYIQLNSLQLRKFCKCASGNYAYKSYGFSFTREAFKYIDSSDNENWEVQKIKANYAASSVRCKDGATYYTNKDYYY